MVGCGGGAGEKAVPLPINFFYLYNFYAVPPLPEKISVPKIIILHFIIIVIIFLCILTQYSIVSHFEVGPRD